MGLPNTKVIFLPSQVSSTASSVRNIPVLIGCTSAGTVNQVTTVTQLSDLAGLGYGQTVDLAGNIATKAKKTFYVCKSATTTQGTVGSVSKVLGNPIGTPTTIGAGNSSMIFTAKQTGLSVTITQRVGNSQATTATFVNGLLTINLGTDNGGVGNATPNAVKTVLDGVAGVAGAMTYLPGGTGLGIMVVANNTALPFGSNGAATTSGNPTNAYSIIVKVTKAGTIGGNPAPYVAWSYDGSQSFNGDTIIPANGILAIKDRRCDSGITLTFTGSLDVGDTFTFTTTEPTSGLSDIIAAMNAALNDITIRFGQFIIVDKISRSDATAIDALIQTKKGTRFLQAMARTRDQGDGVANETIQQYQSAVIADFAGFVSESGLVQVSPGYGSYQSQYTLLVHRWPNLFGEIPNIVAAEPHESIGFRELAYLVKSPIDGKFLYHDERINPGFDDQRFIVARSFEDIPGLYKMNRGWTMSDPVTIGYDRKDWVSVTLETASIVYRILMTKLNSKVSTIPKPMGNAPAGAIDPVWAKNLENELASAVRKYWLEIKSDNEISADDIANPIQVLRNYSFLQTRELKVAGFVQPRGTIESITYYQSILIP